MTGKFRGLSTKCDPEAQDVVVVSLQFEALRSDVDEAKDLLEAGATYRGQALDLSATASDEFRRTIKGAELGKMIATTSGDDSTLIRVAWVIETEAYLEEMFHLYTDFLPMRGTVLLLAGYLRQPKLPFVDVTVTRGAGEG